MEGEQNILVSKDYSITELGFADDTVVFGQYLWTPKLTIIKFVGLEINSAKTKNLRNNDQSG